MIWWETMVTQVKGTDPRFKRIRRFLQQAIFELVQEKSFSSISIQDIAELATVNRAKLDQHVYKVRMFALAFYGKRSLKIKIVRFATGGEPELTSVWAFPHAGACRSRTNCSIPISGPMMFMNSTIEPG